MKTEKKTNPGEKTYDWESNSVKSFIAYALKISEMYGKQLNHSMKSYANFINTSFPAVKTGWLSTEAIPEILKKNTETFLNNLKSFSEKSQETMNKTFSTFSDFSKDTNLSQKSVENVVNIFEKQVMQMIEHNKQLFATLEKELHSKHFDSDSMIDTFSKKIKHDFETSIDVVKKIAETCTNKSSPPLFSNNELVEEINKQIKILAESNKRFWTDTINYFEEETKEKETKERKEQVGNKFKKATPKKVPLTNKKK
ncbi:MAG: hypothetical protein NTX97_05720 [Bacteroidetes bacterium]|nr:hypothetical protein [Bacteroidota bacterium]